MDNLLILAGIQPAGLCYKGALACHALELEQISEIAKWNVFSTLDLKSAYYQIPLCPADRPFTTFEADEKWYHYTRLPFGVTNGVSCFQRIVDNLIEKYN